MVMDGKIVRMLNELFRDGVVVFTGELLGLNVLKMMLKT
jgi:hypothetical protein